MHLDAASVSASTSPSVASDRASPAHSALLGATALHCTALPTHCHPMSDCHQLSSIVIKLPPNCHLTASCQTVASQLAANCQPIASPLPACCCQADVIMSGAGMWLSLVQAHANPSTTSSRLGRKSSQKDGRIVQRNALRQWLGVTSRTCHTQAPPLHATAGITRTRAERDAVRPGSMRGMACPPLRR